MSTEKLEALLESVAVSVYDEYHDKGTCGIVDALKSRLLPLLKAGQAMRDAGKVPVNFVQELGEAQREWDAALKKASEK